MLIRFGFEIDIACKAPVPLVLALSTHSSIQGRFIGEDFVRVPRGCDYRWYTDHFGNQITRMTAPAGSTRLWSDCIMDVDDRPDPQAPDARQLAVPDLPDEVLQFLVPSRYCDSDNLSDRAWSHFEGVPEGWARVQAITTFVHNHVTFGYQFGRSNKTASEVYREKTGVCRDFAHLAIALCRAMNIPARYCSGYLGDIGVPYSGPGDFCAWFEVYLGGQWYTFDARYDTPRVGRILMVRGSDAADVAMITSFGAHELTFFRVWTDQVHGGMSDADLANTLQMPATGEPLVFPSSARAV